MAILHLKAEVDSNTYYTFAMNTDPATRGYFKLTRTDGGTFAYAGTDLTTTNWLRAQNWAIANGAAAGSPEVFTAYSINGTTYNNVSPFSTLSNGEYSLAAVEVLNAGESTIGTSFYNFSVLNGQTITTTLSSVAVIGRPFRSDSCLWTARSTSQDPVQFQLTRTDAAIDPGVAGRKPSVSGSPVTLNGTTYPQYFNYGGLPNGVYKLLTYNASGQYLDEWDFNVDCAAVGGTTSTTVAGTTTTQNTISIGRVFNDVNCVQIARSTVAGQVLFQLLGRNGTALPTTVQGQKPSITSNPVVVLGNLSYRQEYVYGTLLNGDYSINTYNGVTLIDSFDFSINCNVGTTTTIAGTTSTTTVAGATTTVISQTIGRVFKEGTNRVARTNNSTNITFTLTGRNNTAIPISLIGAKTGLVTNPPLTNGTVTYLKEFNYGVLNNGDYTIRVFSSAGQQLDGFDFSINDAILTTSVANTTQFNTTAFITTQQTITTTQLGATTTQPIVGGTTTVNVNTGGINTNINMAVVGKLNFSCGNNQMNVLATFKALSIIPQGTTIAITAVNLPNGVLGCSVGNIVDNIMTFTRTLGLNEIFTVSSFFIANCQKPINNASICLVI